MPSRKPTPYTSIVEHEKTPISAFQLCRRRTAALTGCGGGGGGAPAAASSAVEASAAPAAARRSRSRGRQPRLRRVRPAFRPPVRQSQLSPAAADGLPAKILGCYFTAWDTAYRITDVPLDFNVIYLFHAKPDGVRGHQQHRQWILQGTSIWTS